MAGYSTGTISVTSGSGTVTGSGTNFIGAGIREGDFLRGPDGKPYEVLDVTSATSLTIAPAYEGSTASGQAYRIILTGSGIRDLASAAAQLVNEFSDVRDQAGAGFFGDGSASAPGVRFLADQDTGFYRVGTNNLGIAVGGAGIVSVSSSGVAVTGTMSATGNASFPAVLLGSGAAAVTGRGLVSTNSARFSDDQQIEWGGSSVGIYGNGGTSAITLFVAGASKMVVTATGVIAGTDNTLTLGGASARWSVVYAGTGTINTSDEREKDWRGALSPQELAAAKRIATEIGIYRWLSAIAEKGEAARLHVGVRAQQVSAILEDEGLEPSRYGIVCYDEWEATPATPAVHARDKDGNTLAGDDGKPVVLRAAQPARAAGNRYGIRPDELLFFIVSAQEQRLAALEAG